MEDTPDHRIKHGEKAGWLAPIPLEARRKKVREKATDRRAEAATAWMSAAGNAFERV